MAIFKQIPAGELSTKYTHYGWFCGLCPVYIGDIDSESPVLAERNWIPGLWFHTVLELYGLFIFLATCVAPEWEPAWPIAITGRIPG